MLHHHIYTFVLALVTHRSLQYYEPTAAQALCLIFIANGSLQAILHGPFATWKSPPPSLVSLNATYWASLFLSIFIYRVFIHRLRRFPGPFWARVSKLWTCKIHFKSEYHREVAKLHRTYDDVVRVGPNELDINDVEAIKLIYGTSSRCTKGPWYDGPASAGEARSVQSTRDPAIHRMRRRIWAQAFTASAISEFQPYVTRHLELFLAQTRERKELDIAQWINFLTFDIMGDLTFGESFDMLKTGEQHQFMTTLHRFTKVLSILGAIPWLTSLAQNLPVGGDIKEVEEFSRNCYIKRRAQGSSRRDIFYYLLGEDKETATKLTEPELVIESRTAIVGGSDTTAIVLGALIYYLVRDQGRYRKLQKELDQNSATLDNDWLGNLPYLNAVIQESLRLMPPVPAGLQRISPPEGMELAGQHIPGNTMVSVSAWTVQRDPRNWGQPNSFIPERWLGQGPEPFTEAAWIPFSYGTYGCIGKQLALMELRHITAAIVKAYDMTFAQGFDVDGFELSMKNNFNMTPPRVRVNLVPRP